jgi:hypothetical protein
LVLEQDVMVRFKIDLQRVDWSAAAYRHRGCCGVRVLQFDFDGLGGGVVEVFDGMLFGLAPDDGAGRVGALRGCAVGGDAPGVTGLGTRPLWRDAVNGEFLVGLVVDGGPRSF